jgi:PKD repeat protein
MRNLPVLVVVLLTAQSLAVSQAAFAGGAPSPEPGNVSGRMAAGLPDGFLDIITPGKIAERIAGLQSFGTRFAYTTAADEAADYIFGEFNSTGLATFRQGFFYNGYTLTNVMAVSPGRDASLPWCIVGAHYDSINGTDWSFNPYAPAPGADDDASGVAAVLGLADAFARAPTNRTVIFVAFTGEEQGRTGSREFVRQLRQNGTELAGALCLDMIGYNHRYPKVDIVSNAGSRWLAEMARTAAYSQGLIPEMVEVNDTPIRWSDQLSFWDAGYPSIYLIEDENPLQDSARYQANPYYHTGGDTLDTLNISLMTSVARMGAAAVARLAGLALPDFRPILWPRPATALVGEPAVFNISVQNRGAAVNAVNISFFVDGVLWDNGTLVPDGVQYVYRSWMPAAGSHTVTIVANPDGRHVEWDRSDNIITFHLAVNARPDVYLADIWASDPDPVPGQTLYLYTWVGNSGGAPASARLVISSDTGTVVLESEITLPAGEAMGFVAATTAPLGPVNYSACVTLVRPWETDAADNQDVIAVVPHVLDIGDISLAAVPEVSATMRPVKFELMGDGSDGLQYYYDFGDGEGAGWTCSTSIVHVFTAAGVFNATVTVRDGHGALSALQPVTVIILDQHPVPVIDTDGSAVHAGVPAVFSAGRSYDPDGTIEGRTWEFGDGGVALGQDVSHVFGAPRAYTVRLTVVDGAGFYNITTLQVTVMDDAPTPVLSVGSRILFTGEQFMLNASGSYDRDGRIAACQWSFGDGGSAQGPLANHSFSAPGRYIVNLTVSDEFGVSGSSTTEIIVFATPVMPPRASATQGPRPAVLAAAAVVSVILLTVALLIGARKRNANLRDEEE